MFWDILGLKKIRMESLKDQPTPPPLINNKHSFTYLRFSCEIAKVTYIIS